MTKRQKDLRVPDARLHFETFRDLPFVENSKESRGRTPRLKSEALECSLKLAMALYSEPAAWLEAGEFVEFLLPSDCPCPPTGEALMLALAQRKLLGNDLPKTDPEPYPLASVWLHRSHAERRTALFEALNVLSRSPGWRDSRWGEIPVVAPNQAAVIIPRIRGSSMGLKSLAELAQVISRVMAKVRVTEWAIEEGEDAATATLKRLDGPPGALIIVAHWDGKIEGTKQDYTPDEIKLGLTLGGESTTTTAAALFRAIQSTWPIAPPVLEFGTCHGWRLAKAWNTLFPYSRAFGYPGLGNTGLILHSIADLAIAASSEALPPEHVTALEKVHDFTFAKQVPLPGSGTTLTYDVMRDLHRALWAITKYTRLNSEDHKHELQRSDDVMAGQRGKAVGDQPR